METGHQLFSQEKRIEKSEKIRIEFVFVAPEFCYFNVLNKEGKIKYIGRIEIVKSLTEECSCPDQFHRNNRFYQHEHGFSLQCKHMLKAKKLRGWYL